MKKNWMFLTLVCLALIICAWSATVAETGSGYTVEFACDGLEYVLPGGDCVPLSEILSTLGLTGDVEAVEISNESLFSASKETGKWIVTALRPFSTTEWMKVTIGGAAYEITVTDDADYYVVGTMSNWTTIESYKLAAHPADDDLYYIMAVEFEAGDEIKVVSHSGSGYNWYPDKPENYKIYDDGLYDIYFRPNSNGGDSWFYGCLLVVECGDTPDLGGGSEPATTIHYYVERATVGNESDGSLLIAQNGDWAGATRVYGSGSIAVQRDTLVTVSADHNYPSSTVWVSTFTIRDEYKQLVATPTNDMAEFTMPGYDVYINVFFSSSQSAQSGETTVYFLNTMDWDDAFIHYWGGSSNPDWPGKKMTVCKENHNGHTLYMTAIPADVTGISFSDGNNWYTTSTDIDSGIVDDAAWYISGTVGPATCAEPITYAIDMGSNIHSSAVTISVNGESAARAAVGDTVTLIPITGCTLLENSVSAVYTDWNGQTHPVDITQDAQNPENYTFTMPGGDVTVTAEISSTVTISSSITHGTVAISGNQASFAQGDPVALTFNPSANYVLTSMTYTVGEDDPVAITADPKTGAYTFEMPGGPVIVSAVFTPNPAHFSVNDSGTEYTIHTATGWDLFCDCLNDNDNYNRFSGKTVYLGTDIKVTRMAGSDNHDFCGTFNGSGKTLEFNYGSSGAYASVEFIAPFRYVSTVTPDGGTEIQTTFKNLHITGDIYTSAKYAAGLIARQWGTVNITGCTSSIAIHSSVSGDGTHGGFVAIQSGTINISGCIFDGKLLGENTHSCGGFVGWRGSGYTKIENSFFAPEEVTINTDHTDDSSRTFARGSNDSALKIINDCYTTALGTAQGTGPVTIILPELVTATTESGGTYTQGDTTWYYPGKTITLTVEPDDGYALERLTYTVEGETEATSVNFNRNDDGTYTGSFTMPDGNVTVTATFKQTFTVTFDSTWGSEVAEQTVVDGDTAEKPDDPTWDGYTFLYWYADDEDTAFDFENTPITADTTVTALWVPVFGTPTFTMPSGLKTLGESAFEGMTAMTIVDASNVTSIGKNAFKDSGITQIKLPKDCTINANAFSGCGTVHVYAPAGGKTQTSCSQISNVFFVGE